MYKEFQSFITIFIGESWGFSYKSSQTLNSTFFRVDENELFSRSPYNLFIDSFVLKIKKFYISKILKQLTLYTLLTFNLLVQIFKFNFKTKED